ncbi:MAG: hypothetical protein JWR61_4818 [Ferruginibacter sp.]|uniref:glycoside hydrolase n=1 Tax=Ferruginibacter sp. TaxID=1940288 RepID=UPI00265ACB06|nr:glycoside hydrolase [Ferruginibacter sp.]MDB5279863.1 hypothetical protein [Ferruginibacter sp.]
MKTINLVRRFPLWQTAVILLLAGCNKTPGSPPASACLYNGVDTCLLNIKTTISIQLADVKQTIHSFGASDSWTAKFVGRWSDVNKKNKIADYLFSLDTAADGSPKGIGLSLWRFNIGAGSYEQGGTSGIPDEWRREECFLNADGTYNWSKQEGAQWFLAAAKGMGVKYVHAFSVSPPVYFTRDGMAHGGGGNSFNIQPGKIADYVRFLSTVSAHFNFDYLSPFNEPQWNWGGTNASQEGSAATNTEMADLAKLLGPGLQSAGSGTKIILGEAAQLNFITNPYAGDRGDQLYNWFNKASANYLANVTQVEKVVAGHSYFTTCPDNILIATRIDLNNKRNATDTSLGIWQTEFGILGDVCGKYSGSPRHTTIDYGLYVAKTIHHDLVFANVSSWSWWLAINPYDYSDGLVYINDPSGNINVNGCRTDGLVLDSKQLWCMGNFSRFVRPGMKRVSASIAGIDDATAAASFMVSAYKDERTKKLVVVIINMSNDIKKITLDGLGNSIHIAGNTFDVYTTSGAKNLARSVLPADNIIIEAKSVTTLSANYF